ncbi:MAG: hypothetical protein HUU35_10650, partial [Armatimonadetes bacterium]|nr:hypothetical protein [Armatimonadota bacterium]
PTAASGAGGQAGAATGGAAAGTETGAAGAEIPVDVDIVKREVREFKGISPMTIRNLTKEPMEITVVRFQAGLSPETQTMRLRPRGRVTVQIAGPGTFDINARVSSTGQSITIGQYGATQHEYVVELRQLTPEQIARKRARSDAEGGSFFGKGK